MVLIRCKPRPPIAVVIVVGEARGFGASTINMGDASHPGAHRPAVL
jgi:hypothetical protein